MAHEAVIIAFERRQYRYEQWEKGEHRLTPTQAGERNQGPLAAREILNSSFDLRPSNSKPEK